MHHGFSRWLTATVNNNQIRYTKKLVEYGSFVKMASPEKGRLR